MDNGPASITRPNFAFPGDFFGADSAFVVEIVNVLLDSLPEFGGGRLWYLYPSLLRFPSIP